MAKLFIIGIGGTGSRVIKSLAFLLASGVKINAMSIVPVIIDVDLTNGDFSRTIEILKNYQRIRALIGATFEHNRFFKTAIDTLPQLDSFKFGLNEIGGHNKFKDFIDYRSLDEANKALIDALFTEKNLDTTLEVGFEGNPNMGSVALNQIEGSEGFTHLASNLQEGDRIFIIGSIFGGTGAAGLPLILKNIRGAAANIPNHDRLRKAKIGALAVLPYFGVMPDPDSPIEKSTFISKTKAALAYYKDNINKDIDALYYIGDQETKDYDNHKGASGQKNAAHFVELASALAIIDFMAIADDVLNTGGLYREFGIKNQPDAGAITFTHIGLETERLIKTPLTQYKYFTLFLEHRLRKAIDEGQDFCKKGKVTIDGSLLGKPFYRDFLTQFNQQFNEWLDELAGNTVAFAPFKPVTHSTIFHLLNGVPPKKAFFRFKDNYDLFIQSLNEAEEAVTGYPVEEKFISMFYLATQQIISKNFGV